MMCLLLKRNILVEAFPKIAGGRFISMVPYNSLRSDYDTRDLFDICMVVVHCGFYLNRISDLISFIPSAC